MLGWKLARNNICILLHLLVALFCHPHNALIEVVEAHIVVYAVARVKVLFAQLNLLFVDISRRSIIVHLIFFLIASNSVAPILKIDFINLFHSRKHSPPTIELPHQFTLTFMLFILSRYSLIRRTLNHCFTIAWLLSRNRAIMQLLSLEFLHLLPGNEDEALV